MRKPEPPISPTSFDPPHWRCNLFTHFANGPCISSLNWDLHMTRDWEERVPFLSYVKPGGSYNPRSPGPDTFPLLTALPAEMQLRILAFCTAPTLFHVMHTSSALRIEAKKLFWAHRGAFYLVDGKWIADGAIAADSWYDLSFAEHVQNVEILDERLEWRFQVENHDGSRRLDPEAMTRFWKILRRTFPRARRVVINQNFQVPQGHGFPKAVAEHLRVLISLRPPEIADIDVVIRVRQEGPHNISWRKSLHCQTAGGTFEDVGPVQHKTISMPLKSFQGRVGRFQRILILERQYLLQDNAMGPLVIEALDHQHFNQGTGESLKCPISGCETTFHVAGQMPLHIVRMHCHLITGRQSLFHLLDAGLNKHFTDHQAALQVKRNALAEDMSKIRREWHSSSTQEKELMECEWEEQMMTDEAWQTASPRHSSQWTFFLEVMSWSLDNEWLAI